MSLSSGDTFTVMIRPSSPKSEILSIDGSRWKVAVKAVPEKGKANAELIRFLEKQTGKRLKILSGFTSRKKTLKVL